MTRADIFRGCLIASIMHAIMINKYPELAYEQSWDGANYSIQNSSGLRSTITFCSDFCVGAIRNDNYAFSGDKCRIQEYLNGFPSSVIQKANEETLQYLLVDKDGVVKPCVTSVFWADDASLYFEKRFIDNIKRDFILLKDILLPEKEAISKWRYYYEMDSASMQLFYDIYSSKVNDFSSKLVLSKEQIKLIPGDFINFACVESLQELDVFV